MSSSNLINEEYVIIKLKGKSKWYINGFRSQYDFIYPKALEGYMSTFDFNMIMSRLNLLADTYWACDLCYYSGLCLAPFTLGLSFLIPYAQIHDAYDMFTCDLDRVNNLPMMKEKNIVFSYHKSCFSSYIEIRFPKEQASVK